MKTKTLKDKEIELREIIEAGFKSGKVFGSKDEIEKKYNYYVKIKYSLYESFFKTKEYKIAKSIFGSNKNE